MVARIARGDLGDPLAELVERYKGPLYGYGTTLLGDPWFAEQLVHECFIRLWRTAGRFDPTRASVSTYLLMLARAIAIDLHRREGLTQTEIANRLGIPPGPVKTRLFHGPRASADPRRLGRR